MAESKESIFSQLLSIFFPQRCAHCRAYGEALCPECRAGLMPIGPRSCRRCGKPSLYDVPDCPECRHRHLHFRSAAAAFRYEGSARSLVHGLKYSGQRRLAMLMADLSVAEPQLTEKSQGVTLTYVPMHSSKKFSRGYNQAQIYARAISSRLQLPLTELLVKRNPTLPQNRLNFDDRGKNLNDSFIVSRGCRCNTGKVLLIDDVFTTGATVSECARVLKRDLEVEVDVWTFARTVKN
jgi:ComF family protein